MSRILLGEYLEEAKYWMNKAVEISLKSPCKKDKRGVVIVNYGLLAGEGFNAPPEGFSCEPKYCEPTCKDFAVHAEMNAIMNAIKSEKSLDRARMYQARSMDGKLVNSRKPRCYHCSKHLQGFGIKEFVLKHPEGYILYNTKEFNEISLVNFLKRSK